MKFKEYILMSLRDLWRRKGRTILTSLGITIGTLLIVTMVGLGSGVKQFMNDMVNDQDNARNIQVSPYKYMTEEEQDTVDPDQLQNDYAKPITDDTIKKIETTNKVENSVASVSSSIDYIKYDGKEYKGRINFEGFNKSANLFPSYEVEKVRKNSNDDSLNPIESGKDLDDTDGEILIGQSILNSIDVDPADAVGKEIELMVTSNQTSQIKSKKFKIKGVINEKFSYNKEIIMPINDACELLNYIYTEKDYLNSRGYDYLNIVTSNISDVHDVCEKIKDIDYLYTSSEDMAKAVNEKLSGINTAFAVLGVIVLVVSAIGIVNTMSMAVMERTKSIGVMKSVGANSGAVRTMFLVQSSLIGVIGGGFGILFGLGINQIVQSVANSMIASEKIDMTMSVGLPWYVLLIVFAFAVIISLVSGIYPANKASKLDPIEALRR